MPQTGLIRAEGKVLSCGRRIGTAEGRVTDGKGRLLAHGTTTSLVSSSFGLDTNSCGHGRACSSMRSPSTWRSKQLQGILTAIVALLFYGRMVGSLDLEKLPENGRYEHLRSLCLNAPWQ
jgi:hypothetical protein